MIVVNFKTYPEATGFKAVELARICKEVSRETGIRIVTVPQLADLSSCVETGVDCWVQHVDPVRPGRNTGWVTIESVDQVGAVGTLVNHSEHRLEKEVLRNTLQLLEPLAFEGCVCVENEEEAKMVSDLGPNFVAYEPAELIASKDKSVASEKPEIIAKMVEVVKAAKGGERSLLVGAGVHSEEDVRASVKLGAKGVLVASDVVLAIDQKANLLKLAKGFK